MNEISILSQMLAEERIARESERAAGEREIIDMRAKVAAREQSERTLLATVAKLEAEKLVSDRALKLAESSREESERRCTYLITQMRKTDEAAASMFKGYKLIVTARDANNDIRSAELVPKST